MEAALYHYLTAEAVPVEVLVEAALAGLVGPIPAAPSPSTYNQGAGSHMGIGCRAFDCRASAEDNTANSPFGPSGLGSHRH